ncbi:MAG: alpha/beta hydrolase [Patescibacteria group bacterium]|nr:alpha/beta hydrolase [Patescibacteria group bacterium]
MKTAVIVHCWDGNPEYCWYPWTKKQLEKNNFKVAVPALPQTNLPKLKLWLPPLAQLAQTPDHNLFFIGHSIGCITILRYLEKIELTEKIGGVILVAGFTDNLGYQELDNFFTTPINFSVLKNKANKFISIASDNDPFVPLKYSDIFGKKLNAEVIIKHQAGHFSTEDNCLELPEVVNSILQLIK